MQYSEYSGPARLASRRLGLLLCFGSGRLSALTAFEG